MGLLERQKELVRGLIRRRYFHKNLGEEWPRIHAKNVYLTKYVELIMKLVENRSVEAELERMIDSEMPPIFVSAIRHCSHDIVHS
jgi:hypothetical protein